MSRKCNLASSLAHRLAEHRNPRSRGSRVAMQVISAAVACAGTHQATAQSLYWDPNGVSAGAATALSFAAGTWNATNTNWNTDSSGVAAPGIWQATGAATFSAGTNATGPFTVTVVGTQVFSSINTAQGTVTLAPAHGGILSFHDESAVWHLGTALTINVPIADDATSTDPTSFILFDAGTGALTLGGSNSFTQSLIVPVGGLTITNSNALGDNIGSTTVANGRVLTFSGTINSPEPLEVDSATLTNSTGNATSSGPINLGANGTGTSNFINVASGSTFTMTGLLQGGGGAGPLFKVGVGTAALSGTSSYSGTLTIAGGNICRQRRGFLWERYPADQCGWFRHRWRRTYRQGHWKHRRSKQQWHRDWNWRKYRHLFVWHEYASDVNFHAGQEHRANR